MTIGTRIKQFRQERNITQEQLADSLGITSRAISQWECDRTAPDISQLPALANIFNITTDTLSMLKPKTTKPLSMSLKKQLSMPRIMIFPPTAADSDLVGSRNYSTQPLIPQSIIPKPTVIN